MKTFLPMISASIRCETSLLCPFSPFDLSGCPSLTFRPCRTRRTETDPMDQTDRLKGRYLAMIDLHTHSLLSDGLVLPAELSRRAKVKGYKVIGISDHADHTSIERVIASILKIRDYGSYHEGITILPGVELTHVPKHLIKDLIEFAKKLGIYYVVVHGETLAEPVEEGTNRAAIEGGADILAHPGLISEPDAARARETGTLLEISGRRGHSLANGHVARMAKKVGAGLIFNTDSHSPSDLVTGDQALNIVIGAGLSRETFDEMQKNAFGLMERVLRKKSPEGT